MPGFDECIKMFDYYTREAEKVVWLEDENNLAYYRQCLWLADNYRRWIETLA